jgi:hypothetical protein
MKKNLLVFTTLGLVLGATCVVACTSDDSTTPAVNPITDAGKDSTTPGSDSGPGTDANPGTDSGPDSGPQNPAPPTLGAQIDRMGRPAINTALNHGFDGNAAAAGTAKDAYNADSNPANWVTAYQPQFAANLAILDSLDKGALANDGGGCGNQPFSDDDAGAARYTTLSTVFAGDTLWLNTGSTTCTTYLAVELNATGAVTNTDCGGRGLAYDVIQTTYSAASGVGLSGFGSGVSAVPSKTNGTTFPYLATPL